MGNEKKNVSAGVIVVHHLARRRDKRKCQMVTNMGVMTKEAIKKRPDVCFSFIFGRAFSYLFLGHQEPASGAYSLYRYFFQIKKEIMEAVKKIAPDVGCYGCPKFGPSKIRIETKGPNTTVT